VDDDKLEKMSALAGVVFVVLSVIGAFIAGSPPAVADTKRQIVAFTTDHQDSLKVASYLGGLGIVFFLFFLGVVWTRLRQAEGGSGRLAATAVMGGVATAAIAAVSFAISGYGALHPGESWRTYRLSAVVLGYVSFAAVVFTEATSIVIMRTKFLAAWLGWFGGVVALLWLIAGAAVSTGRDIIFTMGFVAFLAWAVWLVALSVMLYQTSESSSA
jgi:hypothetical protein